ncbi:MAG TPA: tetratricopeptide repeat protein, partial [Pyrinomonadaceae bacterium]|nr:tetratricopeptide repeat protein [Pyrinomonadaceae bacterium]
TTPALTTTDAPAHDSITAADTSNVAATPDAATTPVQQASQEPLARPRMLFVLPALYALALLACVALYTYLDYQSFDAHLTRAANARLRYQHERAIREYTAALALREDPHTRLLLATQLSDARRPDEALREFLAAERGGEPDPRLPFHIASTLDALKRPADALPYYQKFLSTNICAHASPDPRCREAQERVKNIVAETVR